MDIMSNNLLTTAQQPFASYKTDLPAAYTSGLQPFPSHDMHSPLQLEALPFTYNNATILGSRPLSLHDSTSVSC